MQFPPYCDRWELGTLRPQAKLQGLGGNLAPRCKTHKAHRLMDTPWRLQLWVKKLHCLVGTLGKEKAVGVNPDRKSG